MCKSVVDRAGERFVVRDISGSRLRDSKSLKRKPTDDDEDSKPNHGTSPDVAVYRNNDRTTLLVITPEQYNKGKKTKGDKGKDNERQGESSPSGSDGNEGDSGESEALSESPDESDDPEMIELLRQASESESSEDAEAGSSRPLVSQEAQAQRPARRRRGADAPAGTVAVLVQACWMLRIPIIYNDLIE